MNSLTWSQAFFIAMGKMMVACIVAIILLPIIYMFTGSIFIYQVGRITLVLYTVYQPYCYCRYYAIPELKAAWKDI